MRRPGASFYGLLALWALFAAAAAPAVSRAEMTIVPGSIDTVTLDSEGNPDNRAGAHPDRIRVSFKLNVDGYGPRSLAFEFSPGLTGAPAATPTCPREVFEDEECNADTQVGVFSLEVGGGTNEQQPVFNLSPRPNQLATMGFKPLWQTELGLDLRPGDYGLTIATNDLPQLAVGRGQVELWGVPADHVGSSERAALLTTPTQCGPMAVTFRTKSWEANSPWISEIGESEPFTGCEELSFEPELGFQLSDSTNDSPTGAQIDLRVPPHNGPNERVSAYLKDATINMPPGVTVSPGAVEDMQVCTDDQFNPGSTGSVDCPFHSRVGSVSIATPQLAESLHGSIFLGTERPGERFRLFVFAAARGIQVKSVGKLTTNPQTGELAATLGGLPQVALSDISLNFDGGARSLLATPLSCGQVRAHASFISHSTSEPAQAAQILGIKARGGGPCSATLPFSPEITAGSTKLKAGKNTGFSFTLARHSGEQLTKRFATTLPTGLNANLTAVDRCRAAAAAAGSCPPGSRIGTAVAEVGSGSSPAQVRGDVYLTDSYRGAPFGLSIVFDASIGPFHLGSLNVRGALRRDSRTGQLTIETDPLPTIFEGVALRFLTIGIDLDRPGLLVNPTSCQPKQIVSTIYSLDGRVTSAATPFNIKGCGALGFRPRFSLAMKVESARADRPALSISAAMDKGETGLRRFKVAFPRLLAFHSAGIREICPRGDAFEGRCGEGSRVGTGVARTPLLGEPLRGPVYLVQPAGNGFPELWNELEGSGVKMELTGQSVQRGDRLSTEMVDLPDVPLTRFTMHLNGGPNGLFSLKGDPCRAGQPRRPRSLVTLEGQDGAYRQTGVPLKASCSTARPARRFVAGMRLDRLE